MLGPYGGWWGEKLREEVKGETKVKGRRKVVRERKEKTTQVVVVHLPLVLEVVVAVEAHGRGG